MKKLLTLLLLTSGLISVFAQEKIDKSANSNQEFDIVILNGRVMDPETLFDDIANVGIKDGRIATITKQQIKGKETINAKGHVVSPGFIDTHYHTTDLFGAKLGVADGITTAMDLEHGATRIGEWYDNMAKRGAQVNYGSCMIMVGARMLVHDSEVEYNEPLDLTNLLGYINKTAKDGTQGWSVTRSNVDQMNEIMKLLDDGLREGAIGIGVGAAYMARGLTTYEQFEAQRVASRYGRLTSVHNRFHLSSETPSEAQIGFDEVFANALILNAPLLLCHDNDYGWWEHQEKLQMARAQGHNMWGEYYPFTAGQTGISADYLRPEIWEDNYGYKYEETIYDPILDKYLSKDEFLDFSKKEPGRSVVVFFPARKEWLPYWTKVPGMTVASDAFPGFDKDGRVWPWDTDVTKFAGHPRVSSNYSTTLSLAREAGVPLMFTLRQLTYLSAKYLGATGLKAMDERGRMQVGMVADITIFDPENVEPRSTFKVGENGLPPVGIPYVIVNGTIVVRNSKVEEVFPGQPIRFPVEAQGRFEPVDVNGWTGKHTINVPPVIHAEEDNPVFKHEENKQ
jgi:N-acyl-D-amino-acid deacylase